jgi:SAM-dependent methyltransferase
MGGVPYIVFDTGEPLDDSGMVLLSRLSFVYAVYALHENKTLMPVLKDPRYLFNESISTILKYTGKTNELFTRFMLNIAMKYVEKDANETVKLLDPVCGKGTTLFESLLMGCHASGIEIDEKLAYEAYVFYKKYLETDKRKHSTHTEKVGGQDGQGKRFSAARHRISLTGGNDNLVFEIIAGNTLHVNTYYKKNTFHALVGDLPYGVQHGSNTAKKTKGGITRNAMGLLTEALPEWLKVLKPGGVVALAWNLFLIPREEMDMLFESHGLTLPEETKNVFAHRVDQAINRDLIIGVKP